MQTAIMWDDRLVSGGAKPSFSAPYGRPDEEMAAEFLSTDAADAQRDDRVDALARLLVGAIRSRSRRIGGIEDFLHEYSLSTKEGLALMVLAEALLRVPDNATADRLIEDKLAAVALRGHETRSDTLLVAASAWALGLSARILQPHETPEGVLQSLVKRVGLPAMRIATRQAMRLLGSHFVLGQSIEEALAKAAGRVEFRYSFDMLGEGARTGADAERYFDAYQKAVAAIGASAGADGLPNRPGLSVKLSALHPRYEPTSRERVLRELTPRLIALARQAKDYDLNLTVDAEEADRLELSLDVVAGTLADPALAGWAGFGIAVQAYLKRAPAVIDWVIDIAQHLDRRLMVRLVKGAYWDSEVKRAQERGLDDYPVFTRKAMTDLCYLACARKLLTARPRIYPQFATHNALTVASVVEAAGATGGYEFQRLHGMGEALYSALLMQRPDTACRVYAPVGDHRDLLAYLVRRLLENGANSSFVSAADDPSVPVETILKRPRDWIGTPARARHPRILRPRDLYAPARKNSAGIEFGDRAATAALMSDIAAAWPTGLHVSSLVDGTSRDGVSRTALSPIDGAAIGRVVDADAAQARVAITAAARGFSAWSAQPVEARASALERAADLFEADRAALIALLQAEGGKTLDDAVAEIREAADFCRYYADEARRMAVPQLMPGPTGELNRLGHRGRGVFVCISPWNFPLAIFCGQVVAALAAGNSVMAKPAEQTPLIATAAVARLHRAGVPTGALQLVLGDGSVGAALTGDERIAGVAFTGSTEVARAINRVLAARDAPIAPLIAETGGINAMIVDATALPEQVVDDVVASAFRSAGQRCSALRLLCVQDEIADRVVDMIAGAAAELAVGDPRRLSTHVGPVIDADAKGRLDRWIARMAEQGRLIFHWDDDGRRLPTVGTYVGPAIIRLDRARDLTEEVFGPVLHVVRFRADGLDDLVDDIAANPYRLTLGLHTRIDDRAESIVDRLSHGNVYVNRNMIGAVVGTQPFGGGGLSGTGPKAGGPHYLARFAAEQTVTINTAAAGGNASLLSEDEV
jgi:RHH-type transcriptional regulator, proline utilization regulon repressor / proline dehydrogenase / delta 1-pyrroline-5-carboxylate dehydrogenase